jgi:FRG domain
MTTIQIADLAELRDRVAAQSTDSLFRGQVKHFEDENGDPNINTSFNREGCVPPMMLKWQHHAKEILRILSGHDSVSDGLLSDALLQHYGWRSFYVDVTKSPAVAAWFASHKFIKGDPVLEMSEDVNEEFVMLVHNAPVYIPSDQPGNIYVISKTKAQINSAKFYDLTRIECEDTTPRFHTQLGGLIGPFSRLSPSAVLERWEVPSDVLREFAGESRLERTEDLFPARENDIFLDMLLAVPWVAERSGAGGLIFRRGLEIPEYDYRPTRRYSSNTAFSRPGWLSRTKYFRATSLLGMALRFGLEEETFYYCIDTPPKKFERVVKLLKEHPVVVVEIDGIVCNHVNHRDGCYTKGIIIQRVDTHLVLINELGVSHPGMKITGAEALSPWTYQLTEDGGFVRHPHELDCPCNNYGRHEHLFRFAQVFEILLLEDSFRQISALEYEHKRFHM